MRPARSPARRDSHIAPLSLLVRWWAAAGLERDNEREGAIGRLTRRERVRLTARAAPRALAPKAHGRGGEPARSAGHFPYDDYGPGGDPKRLGRFPRRPLCELTEPQAASLLADPGRS